MSETGGSLEVTRETEAPADWAGLMAADPASDYFHTPYWSEAARRSWPGVEVFWLCARQSGRLVGGMAAVQHQDRLARLESGLDGTSGGPLVDSSLPSEDQHAIFQALVAAYLDQRQGALQPVCLTFNADQELRWGELLRRGKVTWNPADNPGAVIDLSGGLDAVDSGKLAMNKRNERNRAQRRGVTVEAVHDVALLRAYYPLFESACEVWGKVPTPLPFLEDLLRDKAHVYFVAVCREGRVLGGHLNLLYGERAIAWSGVTDRQHARQLFPATMAMWGDIVAACERGATLLDLGGSGGVVSLERFKKYFGAHTEQRGHYVLEPASLKLLRGGKKVLDRLRSGSEPAGKRWHDDASGSGGESSSS